MQLQNEKLYYVGGVVGLLYGTISDSLSYALINATGEYAGGMVSDRFLAWC